MYLSNGQGSVPHANGVLAQAVDVGTDGTTLDGFTFDPLSGSNGPVQPRFDDTLYSLDASGNSQSLMYTDFLKDLLFTSPQDNYDYDLRGVQTPMLWDQHIDMGLGFSQALADVPFGDILPISSSITALPDAGTLQTPQVDDAQTPNQFAIAAGTQAFSTSVWHWVPSPTDHVADEHSTLALPSDTPSDSSESLSLSPEVLSKRLHQADRDRVLSILLEQCDRDSVVKVATAFPSHLLMEKLLHTALHFQIVGFIPFIHVATFDPETIRNELLTALVAYGSFLSPVSAIQRLAAAMADVLFMVVPERFCANNAKTRDLQLLQTFALFVHILSWSGHKRRTELGESFGQPILTMLRRASSMSRHAYSSITPTWEDSPAELETKWRTWADQESRIRLVHHVFLHDAQASMTHFTNPLLTAAEMTLPLPCATPLWEARDSVRWREQFFAHAVDTYQYHNLSTQVHDFVVDGALPSHGKIHCERIADMLTLFGTWHLVCTNQLLRSWRPVDGLSSRLQDSIPSLAPTTLMRALDTARDQVTASSHDQVRAHAATLIVAHYLQMALHAPLKAFPVFAGSDGEGEARRVYPMLQCWAGDRESRQAIWHAGQVIRYARKLSSAQMHMFFAVAIYHAGLTLWTFSIIASARHKKLSQPYDHRQVTNGLQLDGDATAEEIKKFVAIGERSPSISIDRNGDPNALIALMSNPGAAMRAGIVTFPQSSGKVHGRSRFVESLVRLMDDLANAAQSLGFG